MPTKQKRKKSPRVFRSLKEFKKHYLPETFRGEQKQDMIQDSSHLGDNMAQEHLKKLKRELQSPG